MAAVALFLLSSQGAPVNAPDALVPGATVVAKAKLATGKNGLTAGAWMTKNGDNMRTGHNQVFSGPTKLSQPAWSVPTYDSACGYASYGSPTIDDEGNIYGITTCGAATKSSTGGDALWDATLSLAGLNPVLSKDENGSLLIYGSCSTGGGFSVTDAETGAAVSQYKPGNSLGVAYNAGSWMTTYSAANDVVVIPNAIFDEGLQDYAYLVGYVGARGTTGEKLWEFNGTYMQYNPMYAIAFEDSEQPIVILQQANGNLFGADLNTGETLWNRKSLAPTGFTTGGCTIREVDAEKREAVAYCTMNSESPDFDLEGVTDYTKLLPSEITQGGHGLVRAINIADGAILWTHRAEYSTGSVPVHDGERVYIAAGTNVCISVDEVACGEGMVSPGYMFALDAVTGEQLWRVDAEPLVGAIPPVDPKCEPDAWANAAVDAKGTVYYGYQGGALYAIEGATGKVLSQYDAGAGIQGEPAIGDGFVVFATCTDLLIFS